jgi:hypothetical protein
VTLTPDERDQLDAPTRAGKRSARTITRPRVLLLSAQGAGGPGWDDRRVAEALGCGHRKPSRHRVLDGAAEARLIALACEETPGGRKRWTLRVRADKLFGPEVAASAG